MEPNPSAPTAKNDANEQSDAQPRSIDASDLVPDLPEVNEAAVAASSSSSSSAAPAAAKPAATSAPSSAAAKPAAPSRTAPVDGQGRPFDPLIHETTDDGKPVLRADGVTLKQRRTPLKEYRTSSRVALEDEQPAAAGAVDGAAVDPAAPAGHDPAAMAAQQAATAATLAGLQLLIMRRAFGEKFGSDSAQQDQLVQAWQGVLAHYGVGFTHPLVGLVVVSGGLVVANLNEPETRSALAKMRDWFEGVLLRFWQRLRGRKASRQQQAGSDSGDSSDSNGEPQAAQRMRPSDYAWPPTY